jgi:hypothetical protein
LLAIQPGRRTLNQYRILGDPLTPLIGDPEAPEKAAAVFAPAPDDPLPVIPLSSWTEQQLSSGS